MLKICAFRRSAVSEDRLRIGYAATVSVGIQAGLRGIELPQPQYANRLSVNSFFYLFLYFGFFTLSLYLVDKIFLLTLPLFPQKR